MNLGNELKRDACPEKYYKPSGLIKDTIPTLISLIIVAFFSGSLFNGGGINTVVTVLIEIVFIGLVYTCIYFMFKGTRKRLSETYISVCENGICGVYPVTGMKNKAFSLRYDEIKKLTAKRELLTICTEKETIRLTLSDASATAALINERK